MMSNSLPMRAYHTQYLHKQIFVALMEDRHDDAINVVTQFIEKFDEKAYLLILRAYLTAAFKKNDKDHVEKDFKEAELLSEDRGSKEMLLFLQSQSYLIMGDTERAAETQKALLQEVKGLPSSIEMIEDAINKYKISYLTLINTLITMRARVAPDEANRLITLFKAETTLKPASIDQETEDKAQHEKSYKSDVMPTLLLKSVTNEFVLLTDIIIKSVDSFFNEFIIFDEEDIYDSYGNLVSTPYGQEFLPTLNNFLTSQNVPLDKLKLSKLSLIAEFWLHDKPTAHLTTDLCQKLLKTSQHNIEHVYEQQHEFKEYDDLISACEYRKALAYVNRKLEKHPGSMELHLLRVNIHTLINAHKYEAEIKEDLKIAQLLYYMNSFKDSISHKWHEYSRNAAVTLQRAPETKFHQNEFITCTKYLGDAIESSKSHLKKLCVEVANTPNTPPEMVYQFLKIINSTSRKPFDTKKMKKTDAIAKFMPNAEGKAIMSYKGHALLTSPGIISQNEEELNNLHWTSEKIETLKKSHENSKNSWSSYRPQNLVLCLLEKSAYINTDNFFELAMKVNVVKNKDPELHREFTRFEEKYQKLLSSFSETCKDKNKPKITAAKIKQIQTYEKICLNFLNRLDKTDEKEIQQTLIPESLDILNSPKPKKNKKKKGKRKNHQDALLSAALGNTNPDKGKLHEESVLNETTNNESISEPSSPTPDAVLSPNHSNHSDESSLSDTDKDTTNHDEKEKKPTILPIETNELLDYSAEIFDEDYTPFTIVSRFKSRRHNPAPLSHNRNQISSTATILPNLNSLQPQPNIALQQIKKEEPVIEPVKPVPIIQIQTTGLTLFEKKKVQLGASKVVTGQIEPVILKESQIETYSIKPATLSVSRVAEHTIEPEEVKTNRETVQLSKSKTWQHDILPIAEDVVSGEYARNLELTLRYERYVNSIFVIRENSYIGIFHTPPMLMMTFEQYAIWEQQLQMQIQMQQIQDNNYSPA